MNIPLAKKSKTDAAATTKRPLAYGLNPRQNQSAGGSGSLSGSGSRTTTSSSFNVLHDNDDEAEDNDDEDEDAAGSRPQHQRSRVNAELAREQAAVRRRMQQELQQHQQLGDGEGGVPVYEYDDEGHPPPPTLPGSGGGAKADAAAVTSKAPPASRYLGGLLKAAEERKRERELLLERKILREQEQEVSAQDGVGSVALDRPQFVTAAYRRKLGEREEWQRNRKVQEEREAAADVTRGNNAGMAMANFYSRLNDNVALGGGGDDDSNNNNGGGDDVQSDHDPDSRGEVPPGRPVTTVDSGDRGTISRAPAAVHDAAEVAAVPGGVSASGRPSSLPTADPTAPAAASVRAARRDKVRQARDRYFVRHPEMRRQVRELA